MENQNNLTDSRYHADWQHTRIKFMLSKYSPEFFNRKRILELGSCNGYIGAYFQSLGAYVYSLEGRLENLQTMKTDYPQLKCDLVDLDRPDWSWGKWDIIINFGLYYHLEKFHKQHLENCLDNSDLMFFESVVYDSSEPELFFRQEEGSDQSLSFIGGNPSTSYVENIFSSKNKKYEKFSSRELNAWYHFYDWEDTGNNVYNPFQRRFWIVQ